MCTVMANTQLQAYVSDRHLISRVELTSNYLTATDGSSESYSVTFLVGNRASGDVDGNATSTRFFEPNFIAIDTADTWLFVNDANNNAIRRVNLASATDPYKTVTYIRWGTNQLINGIALDNNGDGSSTNPRYKNAWVQATLGFRIL